MENKDDPENFSWTPLTFLNQKTQKNPPLDLQKKRENLGIWVFGLLKRTKK